MKRISIYLAILAMAVTLSGCGGKETEPAVNERERSRSRQEESDSKDKEEEIVADGETAVILYYVLNYANLNLSELDDLSPLTTDILEKYWDERILFYDDEKTKVMDIDDVELYFNDISYYFMDDKPDELETGVYKFLGTDDNGEEIKLGAYVFEKKGYGLLWLPGKFVSDENGDGIEFLLGREVCGYDIKDFGDKHNLTDYHDEYEELYPYYGPKIEVLETDPAVGVHSAAPDFSDSDGDAYVEEFLMPKYVDESELPERMRATAHISDAYVLADTETADLLNITEDLSPYLKAAINMTAVKYNAFNYKYIAFYDATIPAPEEYIEVEYNYLITLDGDYFQCIDYVGDGAVVFSVNPSSKELTGEIFGVTIP
ncbi:MAG: hypothetical protein IJ716_15840 [Lachnospiraceae bacterium]|nr:hypothetical protein [Lachnospiraceae bacterium]MBR1852562.1 hypothetical protein [Lachnospiraceae bacterium]